MKNLVFLALIALLASCSKTPELPKTGIWRAVLKLQGQQLPFNLDVVKDTTGSVDVYMINAGERLLLDEVSLERDSVRINLHMFDAQLRVKNFGDSLSGYFELNYTAGYRIPFKAAFGQDFRFTARDKAASMVKRSRVQSQEVPMRRICRVIVEPDSSFHCHTRSRKASRPNSRRSSFC